MRLSLLMLAVAAALHGQTSGSFTVHLILHAVGEERFELKPSADGTQTLTSTLELSDRGNQRTTSATLRMQPDFTPLYLEIKGQTPSSVKINGSQAIIQDNAGARSVALPEQYVSSPGASPFALQMTMLQYWKSHGKPARLVNLAASAEAEPVEIERVGRDAITVGGKPLVLDRLTIANLVFGREIVWLTAQGDLIAAMTFAGGLPLEAVRTEYLTALPQLYRSGVAQEMANLATLSRQVQPDYAKTFAIAGARLVDVSNGAPPIEDSMVVIRNGRITAAGPRSKVTVPKGVEVVDARGQTLLPGLWEMHIHFSGVEFGPALLAAGITTARDCGGEFDYLVAQRDAIERRNVRSPRLLLAGLVDAGGAKAFGHITAETANEGRAVVNRYQQAGFQQIKLYTYLKPDVVRAIAAEAHRLGMTVTGHVPQAFNTFEGIEAGMDQINHLNYATSMLTKPGVPVDVNSEAAQKALQFLKDHHTVVDPTASWGEMAGHPKDVDVASFEPGILKAPAVLNARYRGMSGAPGRPDRRAQTRAVIGALFKAGVPIVPGSDTGLVGYGLHRELEIYVEAGMTPLEAIRSATIISARAMQLDKDSGSIEVGKRADLILVEGDPLTNIGDLRRVSRVVANGRLYDTGKLWRCVGFRP